MMASGAPPGATSTLSRKDLSFLSTTNEAAAATCPRPRTFTNQTSKLPASSVGRTEAEAGPTLSASRVQPQASNKGKREEKDEESGDDSDDGSEGPYNKNRRDQPANPGFAPDLGFTRTNLRPDSYDEDNGDDEEDEPCSSSSSTSSSGLAIASASLLSQSSLSSLFKYPMWLPNYPLPASTEEKAWSRSI